jgi:hypothetical protein
MIWRRLRGPEILMTLVRDNALFKAHVKANSGKPPAW